MCTAVAYRTRGCYLGRNLDLTASRGEVVCVAPRNAPLLFRDLPPLGKHYALIGAALVSGGFPLYLDAVNEAGLPWRPWDSPAPPTARRLPGRIARPPLS